jgi:Flp pilus assembly protein TadD
MEALQQLQAALRITENDPQVWLAIGRAQRLRGSHIAAADSFNRALKLQPDLVEAHVDLGILHADFDRHVEAKRSLEEAYRLGDRSPVTLSYLALVLLLSPNADAARAEQLLKEAGEPAIPPALFARGLLLRAKGAHAEAEQAFKQVLAADPRHERAQFALAETLRQAGDRDGAARAMKRHHQLVTERQRLGTLSDRLSSEGPQPRLLREYGEALLQAGRVAEAREQFQTWASRAPGDPEARRSLERAQRLLAARP